MARTGCDSAGATTRRYQIGRGGSRVRWPRRPGDVADFEERIYSLGVEALAEQERQVSEVRGRASAILAAAAVVPSLLAHAVFHDNHPHGVVEVFGAYRGIAGAIGVLVCTVNLLRPRSGL
jgi:hypothetical protein